MDHIKSRALSEVVLVDDPDNPAPRIVVNRRTAEDDYRWRLINIALPLRIGDRIELEARDDLDVAVAGCAQDEWVGCKSVLYIDRLVHLQLKIVGRPKSKVAIDVNLPEIPAAPAKLCGPMEPQQFVPDAEIHVPLDRYFVALDKLVIDASCNFMSICPIAYWTGLDFGAPWARRPPQADKYDLSTWDPLWWRAIDCLFWRAARAGVVVHLYPFDFVAYNHANFWEGRSPLYAGNNVQGWFTESTPRGYKGFHRAIKDKNPRVAYDLLTRYFARCASLLDPSHHHAIVPQVEGQSRSVDHVLAGFRGGRTLGVNLKSLYQDTAWPEMAKHLAQDLTWRELLRWADFVSIHSCDTGGITTRMISRLMPFARELQFGFLASTDGAGSGQGDASKRRRPDGSRPNVADLIAIDAEAAAAAGERYRGLEIKIMSWEDGLATLPAMASRIL